MNETNTTAKVIGKNIRHLRHQRELTTKRLAEALGVSQSTVTTWETATRTPKSTMLDKIATYFDITVAQLTGDIYVEQEVQEFCDLSKLIDSGTRLIWGHKVMTDDDKQKLKGLLDVLMT